MSDAVELVGLRALGIHGALPHEQLSAQPFEIDLRIETDMSQACASDDLADAVDYGVVVGRVLSLVESSHFQLLEALADAIAWAVLADARVSSVVVSLRKLRPPVPAHLKSAGVRITRNRKA